MMMIAIAVLPLIQSLLIQDRWDQNWYTGDSACSAKLPMLLEWFDKLLKLGPEFGYYPERKTFLVVDPRDEVGNNMLFSDLGVNLVIGHSFLGGFVGDQESTEDCVE